MPSFGASVLRAFGALFRRRRSLDRLNRLAAELQHALRVGDCSDIQGAHRRYESELRLWTNPTTHC
jgi:hypothetical protein